MSSLGDTQVVTPAMLDKVEKRLHSMFSTLEARTNEFESHVATQIRELEMRLASQNADNVTRALESMRQQMRLVVQEVIMYGETSFGVQISNQIGLLQEQVASMGQQLQLLGGSVASSAETSDELPQARDRSLPGYSLLRQNPDERQSLLRKPNQSGEQEVGIDLETLTVTVTNRDIDVESASQEYRSIVTHASEEYDLHPDIWGATEFLIIKDFADVAMGDVRLENILRIGMVMLVYGMNFFLQMMFLFWTVNSAMLPNIKEIQETYQIFHSVAFPEGHFDKNGFHSLGERGATLCHLAVTTPTFMSACLLLWVARCLHELRGIYRRKHAVDILPGLPRGVASTHMVHEISLKMGDYLKEEKNIVVCLNATTRIWLGVLVFIPRVIVALSLLFIGTAFLTATASASDLILNSLAMGFIFEIDELLFNVFLPKRLRENLHRTTIKAPPKDELMHMKGMALDVAIVKRVYLKSSLVLFFAISFLLMWLRFQPILPGFEYDIASHCAHYLNSGRTIPCKLWDGHCFPKSIQ